MHHLSPLTVYSSQLTHHFQLAGDEIPTEEELHSLPRVSDGIKWSVFFVAFVY